MATNVSYTYAFAYRRSETAGDPFPTLLLRVWSDTSPQLPLEIEALLDSGAVRSLFDGRLAQLLGIDLLKGRPWRYFNFRGDELWAHLHRVHLSHAELGDFAMEVGFSTSETNRNILGRDFFDQVQIGFREHHLLFYIEPIP